MKRPVLKRTCRSWSSSHFSVKTLLGPKKSSLFQGDIWPENVLVHHAPTRRLSDLLQLRELRNGDYLMKNWFIAPHYLDINGMSQPTRGGLNFGRLAGADLRKRFETVGSAYFTHVERALPATNKVLRSFERNMGLKAGTATMQAFVGQKGTGAPAHFDFDYTFNIQLLGQKTWHAVEQNLSDWKGLNKGPSLPKMPPHSPSYELQPGSTIYLPLFAPHSTFCQTDSFAVAIVVCGPKWHELVISEVQRLLMQDMTARKVSLIGRHSTPHALRDILKGLANHLLKVQAQDLIEQWQAPTHFRFELLSQKNRRRHAKKKMAPQLNAALELLDKMGGHAYDFEISDILNDGDRHATYRNLQQLLKMGLIQASSVQD
jgi:ribosomal protein L16 Arg81 hydroxylase